LDYFLFQQINNLAGRWPVLDWLGIFAASYLQYVLVIFLLVFLFFDHDQPGRTRNRKMVFWSLVASLISRFGIASPLYYFFMRPRPFVSHQINQLIPYDAWRSSFPSGHASFLFALAAVVYFYNRKLGIWFLSAAALISLARVYVGVHYPADILAGALIGFLVGGVIFYIQKTVSKKA